MHLVSTHVPLRALGPDGLLEFEHHDQDFRAVQQPVENGRRLGQQQGGQRRRNDLIICLILVLHFWILIFNLTAIARHGFGAPSMRSIHATARTRHLVASMAGFW